MLREGTTEASSRPLVERWAGSLDQGIKDPSLELASSQPLAQDDVVKLVENAKHTPPRYDAKLRDITAVMKVLSLSDKVLDTIYNPSVKQRFGDIDLVLGCGDLPYYYLEYLVDTLRVPVFYVRGNHAVPVQFSEHGDRNHPWGAVDLDGNVVHHNGMLIAGFEGSVRYRQGPYMYTQGEMWWRVFAKLPRLLWNRLVHGRALDILVTHAPPRGVGDRSDLAHHGFDAFRWLLRVFKPRYHFHGHIHEYDQGQGRHTHFCETEVINTYGYLETELDIAPVGAEPLPPHKTAKGEH